MALRVFSLFIALFLGAVTAALAAESGLWGDNQPASAKEKKATIWNGLAPSERYHMAVIDDFEERVPWSTLADLPAGSLIRMVKGSPADGAPDVYPRNLYEQDVKTANESAKIRKIPPVGEAKYCQEIQLMIHSPGYDALLIRPPDFKSAPAKGMPIAVSLWVYGYGKRHVLYAMIRNTAGVEMPLRMGELNFRGWRRLEVPLKHWMLKKKPFEPWSYSLAGLKLVSHPKEKPGLYLLRIDLVQVLVDYGESYPGSQIEDEF